MQAKRYTHADHSVGEFLHVSAFIPEPFKEAARLADQVKHAKGQSHLELTKTICRLWREGLK